jgi:MFS transporter, putative metabolite:H+ symporter
VARRRERRHRRRERDHLSVPGRVRPEAVRGRFIGSLSGFFSFGFVFAALLGRFVIPTSPDGWRIVQVISALPVVMLLWWRRALPESPRWLIERGRAAEAERIEAEVLREGHPGLPPIDSVELAAMPYSHTGRA